VADPLRLGVVGVGALALRGILPHLTQPDVAGRVRVTALCDPVRKRAEAAAAQFGVPSAFATIEELLADGDADAVTIASPIGLHHEHCRLALEAGKHVHVNKTLCTTVREADELIELAHDRGLRIVASPGEVLRPHLRRTRELLDSGAIGELSWAICGAAFEGYHDRDEPERLDAPGGTAIDPAWYFRRPGGGPMYDMTVYSLHQLTSVLGPARRVTAMSGIRIPAREFRGATIATEADDNTVLLLDYGDGVFVVAHGTAAGHVTAQLGACVFHGTRGTIEGVLLNGERFDDATRDLPVDDSEGQNRALPHVVGVHRTIGEAHVFEDVMQLVDWVTDGQRSPVTAEHARHVIDIIECGYRAAETGQTQELATSFGYQREGAFE
jgi:predicted dehydrogenase